VNNSFTAEIAETAWFDRLTMSAHPEPFDSPLILSPSKDEQLAQDRPVEGCALRGKASSFFHTPL
jgi:hypothetical protein